ncbi:uncharacterized protein LODBEIA_P19780 [Lodderomyces beijingensis]|uniref:Uncharacterized protein n=1 Tax=Lodderomyces beijingensis TaxID=1775926 RepID=A0ABP0ZHX5_9ASCO
MSATEYIIDSSLSLSSSECIVVDNQPHSSPYLLLSPLGFQKLQDHYGSQLERTTVETYEEEENLQAQDRVRPEDEAMARLVATSKWLFFFALKVGVAAYILGLRPTKHMRDNWIQYLILLIVGLHSYVMFAPRLSQVRLTYFTRVEEKIAQVLVYRTRDFEYIVMDQPAWYVSLYCNAENVVKDVAVFVLTLIPSFSSRMHEELERQKRLELDEFAERMCVLYYRDPTPLKNIEQALEEAGLDPDLSEMEVREIKFDLLAEYHSLLKEINSR